ncbi:hypothetical protein [Halorarius halobius]|uniref:hypothetical protein n=1 Tax=Halorarius halobius TaxID=2962671 RepID=UPI0020CD592D|nr:hypothetical protein [Halorarius halobius]
MDYSTDPNAETNTSANRTNTDTDTAPDTFVDLREQFDDECVLHTLSKAHDIDRENPPTVNFLDEDTGRVYRVLEATRGSPDAGWFVLALAGPHADDSYERQLRVHDSDTHRVLLGNEIENYAQDEPTPADDVITTGEGTFILRMGEHPIPIGEHHQERSTRGDASE